jgi:tetratricopeptide (TPR) repeat protein
MIWIGGDYSMRDRNVDARRVLDAAYQITRTLNDPLLRGRASCELSNIVSRDEEVDRAEALFQEGVRELQGDPRFALEYSSCLRNGSEVARNRGDAVAGIERARAGMDVLKASPLRTDVEEMSAAVDLASAYSEAGQDLASLPEFARAEKFLSELGLDETNFAVILYNNWGLELDQMGRPLEAEKTYRHIFEISKDAGSVDAISPEILINDARILREVNRIDEAEAAVSQAYVKAVQLKNEVAINQSLMERSNVYLEMGKPQQAEAMLAEVEPRLKKSLPSGHYAFASMAERRARIALRENDLETALSGADRAVSMLEATIKAGGEGSYLLPTFYIDRSEIDRAANKLERAVHDADRAITLLQPTLAPGAYSRKVGLAQLARARALAAQGNFPKSREAAQQAASQLEKSVGPDHPDVKAAQELATAH